jgi:hypothetical protein
MTTTYPWLRRMILTLGPVAEWAGATSQGSGDVIQITSDGSRNGLRITANVNKSIMGIPMPSTFAIYNLSSKTRTAIQASLTKLTLEAGWSNTITEKVFQGSVLVCYSERQGPDIVTVITALQGVGPLIKSVISKTYAQGTSIVAVIQDIAARIPGIVLSSSGIKGVTGQIGFGGWSFAGSAKDALTALANEYGFSWMIDNGSLYFIGDKAQFSGTLQLNGNNGGLINVSPILSGPLQMQIGVNIKALYAPGVSAGSVVNVNSSVMSKLNGNYRIHTAAISLDCYADVWEMSLESFKYSTTE